MNTDGGQRLPEFSVTWAWECVIVFLRMTFRPFHWTLISDSVHNIFIDFFILVCTAIFTFGQALWLIKNANTGAGETAKSVKCLPCSLDPRKEADVEHEVGWVGRWGRTGRSMNRNILHYTKSSDN